MAITRTYAFPVPASGGGAVDSVFTRTGAVVADAGDYAGIYEAADADLAAVAALGTTGIARRTGAGAWSAGTLVTLAEQADLAGLSVPGRSANSTGVQAAITAANDAEVLRRSGTALGFGQIATAGIADAAVTLAKQANLAGLSVPGRSANSAGVQAAITAATVGHALQLADDGASLGWREPSFAVRTLAGAVRAGRFAEASGTAFLYPLEAANAVTSTTIASVANRCMFYRMIWEWTANQRFDAMVCEVTTGSGAGTTLRMALYAEGSDGLPATRIWYSSAIDANAIAVKTELLSAGTWVDTSYKDASGYLYAPPGTVIWGALHTESTPTMRALAPSALRPLAMLVATLTSQNLLYLSSAYGSGVPTAPSGFTTANGNKQILCLRGVP